MKIALDAMGGDFAPAETVRGAVLAAQNNPDITILMVGTPDALEKEFASVGAKPKNIEIVASSQTVEMSESPVDAIRRKPDSSLFKSINLVKKGEASAIISAGNTGAAVAGSTMTLGFLPNVKRPGIAIPVPSKNGICYVIDAGANIYCNPLHLLQYGIMASVYCQQAKNIANPRVGVLNIGEEDSKGNELVKQTIELFRKTELNFIGSVEGRGIFEGQCEVVVCEGFVGNVLLKTVEGFAEFMLKSISAQAANYCKDNGGTEPIKNILGKIKERTDYAEYGGAPLLGLNGIVIISHGRSNAKAIANAIKVAGESTRHNLTEEINKGLNTVQKHISWMDVLKSWRATHR
ncbi:MAG: phosphate acyltransferase PlsX [Planctomycetes bacterium]|nr:phosphate acyltransferase PlsX [Planctomycetota bacterium]